jgi:hypothetical protein
MLAASLALALCATTAVMAQTVPNPLASSTVLNFDNLTGAGDMPAGYGGFDWTSWFFYDQDQPGVPYFANSPDTRLTALSNFNKISRVTPFVFEGAWISGVASATVHYQLWLGGAVVANLPSFHPNNAVSTWQPSSYAGNVDTVVVIGNDAPSVNHFVIDDFTYSAVSAVPEPVSAALIMGGLAVLLAARRRSAGTAGH